MTTSRDGRDGRGDGADGTGSGASVDETAAADAAPARSPEDVRVVAFGGGTGMSALLAGLKSYTANTTAVVTVTDNGGSSGRLRNDFDMVAPGDIRNCLIALADVDPIIASVFQYRFQQGEFKDHNFGNLFITVLTRVVGKFEDSIRILNGLLKVRGRVIPASSAKVSLVAHHFDGSKSTGEVEITRSRRRVEKIELRPSPVPLSREIREAVEAADLFLFGPGSLFTSVVPNLLLEGLMEAINSNGSPRVYIGNIMTQPGETDGFQLSDHVRALRRHVGEDFPDWVISHRGAVPRQVLEKYAAQGAKPVADDLEGKPEFAAVRVISGDFFRHGDGEPEGMARHDSETLARAIHDAFLAPLARGGADAFSSRPRQVGEPRAPSYAASGRALAGSHLDVGPVRGDGARAVKAGAGGGALSGAREARPGSAAQERSPAVSPPRHVHGTRTLD